MKIAAKIKLTLFAGAAAVLGLGLFDYHQSRQLEKELLQLRQFATAETKAVIGIRESLGVLHYALASLSDAPDQWTRATQTGEEALNTIRLGFDRLIEIDGQTGPGPAAPEADGPGLRAEAGRALAEFNTNWAEYNRRLATGRINEGGALRLAQLLPAVTEDLRPSLDRYIASLRLRQSEQINRLTLQSRRSVLLKLGSGGALLALAGLLTFMLHRGVLAPLRQLETEAGHVSRDAGHFRLDATRADEVGSVARALNGMLDAVQANTISKVQLETALRAQANELDRKGERLALALEAARTSIWDYDLASGAVTLDAGWSLMLGGQPAPVTSSARRTFAMVHPQDRAHALQGVQECFHGKSEHYNVEYRVRNRHRGWTWVHSKGRVTARNARGEAVRMTGTNTDITARKTAELSLARQVEFLNALNQTTVALLQHRSKTEILEALTGKAAALLESIQVEVALIEADKLITHAHGGSCQLHPGTGATRAEAWLSWQAVDSRQPVIVDDLRAVPQSNPLYRQEGYRSVAVFPIMLGSRCLGVLGFLRTTPGHVYSDEERQKGLLLAQLAALVIHNADIYEHAVQVAEARTSALRDSEQLYRSLVESVTQGYYIADARSLFTYCNPAMHAMGGFAPGELLGQSSFRLVAEEDRPQVMQSYRQWSTDPAVTHATCEFRVVARNGRKFWVEQNTDYVRAKTGRIIEARNMLRDITERKEAEAALRQSEAQLRQAQKMESLGTLAGGIAHDFNNILTGILGHAQLALGDLAPTHPAHPWMEGILKSGGRAKNLVQQILTFSRKTGSTRSPVRLQAVALESVGLLRATLPAMVRLQPAIDDASPAVLADPTQIHQVILNLCTNAWHALPEGGGLIEVGLRPHELTPVEAAGLPPLRPGPHVLLTVRDNGQGMDPAIVDRIFEPFFTTKLAGKGTGLGLAVVHSIVAAHDGAIAVRSTPGQGTIFAVYLPALAATEPGAGPAPPAAPPVRGRGEHLLVVDDEPASGMVITRLLDRLGYRVTYCTDPQEALTRLAERDCALLISDLAMPEMSGDELARRARAQQPDLPVLLLSGFFEPSKLASFRALGVREMLGKPPDYAELASAVARCLRG